MYSEILVPLDGSAMSARSLPVAVALGAAMSSPVKAVSIAPPGGEDERSAMIDAQVEGLAGVTAEVVTTDAAVADVLGEMIAENPGTLACISTVGHSHTGAALGSTSEGLLQRTYGPLVLVGPSCNTEFTLSGSILATVDGSDFSEAAVPVATAWAVAFGLDVEIIEVHDPDAGSAFRSTGGADVGSESGHVQSIASDVRRELGRDVNFEVLHNRHAEHAIVEHALASKAALLAMATHGKSGLGRLVLGSVTMATVHRAPCPVITIRPPDLGD
ncbi:MAG: universal stress protein [Acidimicrobiales bacterium]